MDYVRDITRHYNRQLFLSSALLTLSSANYAFDNNGFSNVQAMVPWLRRFGWCDDAGNNCALQSWFLSLSNSITFVPFAIGLTIGTYVQNKYGRRWVVFSMSLWALFSACLIVSAQTRAWMITARALNYFYVGMELSVIPVYQAEIMPREVRGIAVGSYQMSFSLGGLIMTGICRGTSTINDDRAWQIPQGLYFIVPTIVASLIWRLPESPRWLLLKGRVEDARIALTRIRVDNSPPAIQAEIDSIQLSLELEADSGRWRDLFKGINSRRTWIVIGQNFFLQATGQAFTSTYGAVFISSLNTVNPFTITVLGNVANLIGTWIAQIVSDKVGRRPLLIWGATGQAVILFAMAGAGLASSTDQTKAFIVACVPIFNLFFSGGYAPTSYMITSEMPEQRLRDKTIRIGGYSNLFTNWLVAFSLPYALNSPGFLGARVGFIFGPMAILAVFFAYFSVPECRGRSLEEVDLLFHNGITARGSVKWRPESTTAELLHAVELSTGGAPKAVEADAEEKDVAMIA